jgi:hypothetical protein
VCVIRHNLNFSLSFTLDCADHTFGVSMYLGSRAPRKHDRRLPTDAPTPHNTLNRKCALSIRLSRLQSPGPLTMAHSSWLRLTPEFVGSITLWIRKSVCGCSSLSSLKGTLRGCT